jgi:prefoldin subunit 5
MPKGKLEEIVKRRKEAQQQIAKINNEAQMMQQQVNQFINDPEMQQQYINDTQVDHGGVMNEA